MKKYVINLTIMLLTSVGTNIALSFIGNGLVRKQYRIWVINNWQRHKSINEAVVDAGRV
jgi:GMP synthase PP-ATPase subunit